MRFGLIGAGSIGLLRAKAFEIAEGCELTAVADIDAEKAKRAALSPGTQTFDDASALIKSGLVDAVIVSTPPPSHEVITVQALEAGKHVLCEKPLANSLDASRRMVEVARRSGRTLATGYNFRFAPPVRFMKDVLRRGTIGELDHVRAFAGHVGLSEFFAPWEYDKKVMGGGALLDIGTHMIDLVHYMLGDVAEVYGVATGGIWRLDGSEDNGFAIMRNAKGKVAQLHATWAEWKGYTFRIEAYGDRGMVQASYGPMSSLVISMDKPGGRPTKKTARYVMNKVREKVSGWQYSIRNSLAAELSDFVRLAGGSNAATIADGFAGFRAVEIANAVYRSSTDRKPVTLVERF